MLYPIQGFIFRHLNTTILRKSQSLCKHHHQQQQFYSHFFAFQNFQIFKRIQVTYCKVSNTPNTDCLMRYNPAKSATTVNFTQFIDDRVQRILRGLSSSQHICSWDLFNSVVVASLVLLLQSILRQISSSSLLNLSSTLSMSSPS